MVERFCWNCTKYPKKEVASIKVKPFEEIKLRQKDEGQERRIRQKQSLFLVVVKSTQTEFRVLYVHRFL